MITDRSVSALGQQVGARRRPTAFTLVEIMVAMTILGLAMTIVMVVFIAAVKRGSHTETMLKGTAELRYAADMISQTVRSASEPPTVNTASNSLGGAGTQLYITPGTIGYLMSAEKGAYIDSPANTVNGTKAGQKNIKVDAYLSTAAYSPFSGSLRPSNALTATDVATYFKAALDPNLPSPKVGDFVRRLDTLTIPQTSYGPAQTVVLDSVSQNAGTATVTAHDALSYSLPWGTKLSIQSTHTQMFAVTNGQLQYYPDSSVKTNYMVLASDISDVPLTDTSNTSGTKTTPFSISATNPNFVTINLQMIPKGTTAGRTLQGVQTTVSARTNPLSP